MLFNSSREFSYPQFSLSAISLSEFGKSHFGSLRSTRTPFSCKTIPRPPMVNGSTLFSIGDFPYREIRGCGVVRLLQHKTPTARHLSSTRSGGPTQLRHLSARVIGDRDFTGRKFLALQNPESRFSDATCQHLPGRPTSGHLSPSRSIGISRLGSSHLLIHKVTDPAKPRIPTPPDLPPRVLSPINGSGRFGKSLVAISKGLSPCLQERRTPNSDPQ